jgi:ADP-ribosylation factor GTPase-activating protein 2/3
MPAVTSRLVQPRKPSGKLGGGLGVKKLETKVDDTLFEQAPAAPEPVKQAAPAEAAAADAGAATQASGTSTSSRFAYDALNAAPIAAAAGGGAAAGAAAARGKDGHLTLGLSNDDFFRDPLSAKGLGGRPGSGQCGGYGGMGGPAVGMRGADAEPVAQKKFGNAKAISSK